MNREQLETIANQFNIKKIKGMEDVDLAFAILDAQATEASHQPDADKPKARRGRPRKDASKAQPAEKKTESAKAEKPAKKEQPAPAAAAAPAAQAPAQQASK